jgi:hypothetical protein
MPNHLIAPYPAELETNGLMLAPNTAYQLLNPVSPEQQVAKAESRKHVTRPQYTVSPEQQVARAEHVARPQYTVSPEQQVAKAEARNHVTQAPTGFGGCPPDDRPCSGNGPLSPAAQNTQATTKTPPDVSGSRAVVGQTNVPQ